MKKQHSKSGVGAKEAFYFQQRRGRLDLRVLGGVDVDALIRNVDIDVLQSHIENITFSNLREEDLRFMTDPHIIKMFRLSQLMIEYLLYAQEQLVGNLNDLALKYGEKKRTLMRKQSEVAELIETSKHLKAEVKLKKQSISTLEEVLKSSGAARYREQARKDEAENRAPANGNILQQATVAAASAQLFYVVGPGGLSIEFTNRGDTSVEQLAREVLEALVPRKMRRKETTIKLVHQGKMLLADKKLEACGIRSGDSIMAVVEGSSMGEERDDEDDEEDDRHFDEKAEGDVWRGRRKKATVLSGSHELEALLRKQQEAMLEMRQGWESALRELTLQQQQQQQQLQQQQQQQQQPQKATLPRGGRGGGGDGDVEFDVMSRMDERWNQLERAMRHQLDEQLTHYEQRLQDVMHSNNKFNTGELEDDNDAGALSSEETEALRRSVTKVVELEEKVKGSDVLVVEMRNAFMKQSQEIADLKTFLAAKKEALEVKEPPKEARIEMPTVVIARATVAAPEPEGLVEEFVAQDDSIVAAESPIKPVLLEEHEAKQQQHIEVVEVEEEVSIVVEKKKEESAPSVIEELEEHEEAQISVAPPLHTQEVTAAEDDAKQDEKTVRVVFPLALNEELASFMPATEKGDAANVSITVAADIGIEDLVFELRKEVSNKISVALARVSLSLNGHLVMLGLDVNESFTPQVAAAKAASGELIIKVGKEGATMTDSQLDDLVMKWQKAHISSKGGDVSPAAVVATAGAVALRRSYDDSGDEAVDHHVHVMRSSLEDAYSGLSDLEGLSDEELAQKVRD